MDQALFRILDIIKTMTRNNRAFFDLKKLLPIGILLFGTLVVMATMWWSAARDRQQTTKLLTDPDALRALEEEVRQSPQAIEKSFLLANVYYHRIFVGGGISKAAESLKEINSLLDDAGVERTNETQGDLKRINADAAELSAQYGVAVSAEATKGELLMRNMLDQSLQPEEKASAYVMLGHFQRAQHKFSDARVSASKAEQLDPISPFPNRLRAEVLDKQGNYENAISENQTAAMKTNAWAGVKPTFAQTVAWELTSPSSFGASNQERNWREQKKRVAEAVSQDAAMHIILLRSMIKLQTMENQHPLDGENRVQDLCEKAPIWISNQQMHQLTCL